MFVNKARLAEIKALSYVDYLKTPEWREIRKQILERDGFRCVLCNTKGFLHVHHRRYGERCHEESIDLVTLCANCHHRFHIGKPKKSSKKKKQAKPKKKRGRVNVFKGGSNRVRKATKFKSCIVPKSQLKTEIIVIGGKGMRSDGQ